MTLTPSDAEPQTATYHFGFILEQALGHITHGQNLQSIVPQDPQVTADWGLIAWEVNGWAARLPLYKSNWTVRSGLRARRALAQIQRRLPLDGLFFHTQVPATLASDWLDRIPSVLSLDATPRQYDRLGAFYGHQTGPAWLEHFKWTRSRENFRKARHLIAWSEWAKQGLIAEYGVPAEKVSVIPPGVNTRLWERSSPPRPVSGPVQVLFVGGNLERKGGLLLLEAFRALRQEGLPVELHLVTREQLPPEPGLTLHYNLPPNSPEIIELYHNSDIFCLPTYGDCLPMVLSEAAAAGLPMISTRVAGIPEVVCQEQTGLLTAPGDLTGLIEALRALLTRPDLRARMGAAALQMARTRLDAEQNAFRLLDLMKWAADEFKIRRTTAEKRDNQPTTLPQRVKDQAARPKANSLQKKERI